MSKLLFFFLPQRLFLLVLGSKQHLAARNHCPQSIKTFFNPFLQPPNGVFRHLSFSRVLFLLWNSRRSSVFLFRKMTTVATRRLTRVTSIATVMATASADATYDNTHINTHTRTSTARHSTAQHSTAQWQGTKQKGRYSEAAALSVLYISLPPLLAFRTKTNQVWAIDRAHWQIAGQERSSVDIGRLQTTHQSRSRLHRAQIRAPVSLPFSSLWVRLEIKPSTLPASLVGPLSMLPPKPSFSQNGGAQCASQWQFFLLLHTCI